MKTLFTSICIAAMVLVVSLSAFADECPEPRLITVTGDAEVRVEPDEVVLTLGVETWDQDLDAAKTRNDQRTEAILKAAEKLGLEKKHIQTDHISIEPRYEDQWEHRDFVGYFVRKTIIFTLRDISKFEELLSAALQAGANYVHGIQFRTTELRTHRDQARSLAIKAASEKANDLAKELGQKLGKPHMIREDHVGWWSWYNGWWGSRWSGGMAQNVIQNVAGQPSAESGIAPGQITVNARVTVSFVLE
ncbi:MAG: SIMPL domain-containing protein [Candidatus Abyssubacteria bacterium]